MKNSNIQNKFKCFYNKLVFFELLTWAKSRTAAAAKSTALANMINPDILSLDRLYI